MAKRPKIPKEVREWFRQVGVEGGRRGGLKAAANMTPEQRIARAKKAAAASAAVRSAKAKAKREESEREAR
ncbi:MAG: hypothetical protein LC114_07815 [Bryobacterales bacterium]|nr:hypothetical protein [Bryobacterales bacterium]